MNAIDERLTKIEHLTLKNNTMSTLNTLKRLQREFEYCGNEENFTNFCFNYGLITKEYRNETERNVIFNVNGIITEIVMIKGTTNSIKINF